MKVLEEEIPEPAPEQNQILAWTTMETKDKSLHPVHIYSSKTLSRFINYNNYDSDWLIFTTGYAHNDDWKAKPSFGSKIIAVDKKNAYETKVVARPTRIHTPQRENFR